MLGRVNPSSGSFLGALGALASLAILIGLPTLAPSAASACSCRLLSVEEARDQAAAIFEGRVEAIEEVGGALRVRVHVTQAWRGVDTETVTLHTAGQGSMCGYAFTQGEHYLVYASRSGDTGPLQTSLCSRTRLARDADEDRRVLGSGTIPVDVEDRAPPRRRRSR